MHTDKMWQLFNRNLFLFHFDVGTADMAAAAVALVTVNVACHSVQFCDAHRNSPAADSFINSIFVIRYAATLSALRLTTEHSPFYRLRIIIRHLSVHDVRFSFTQHTLVVQQSACKWRDSIKSENKIKSKSQQ